MSEFKKYDFALIGIRLLIIYLALQVIAVIPQILTLFVDIIWRHDALDYPFAYKILILLLPLLSLLPVILLWLFSSKIARFTTKANSCVERKETTEKQDIQEILFCAIGIFILITSIPNLIIWVYHVIDYYRRNLLHVYSRWSLVPEFISVALEISLSLILIFKAKVLSELFYRLRRAGIAR
ncbi:MAG TPA: hypothetical protein VHE99_06115 [Gammaproteobacteria bacterium]|nr:hypothetical protein [Gammaproteobacteria bacterium]